jgi:hypothetical protein
MPSLSVRVFKKNEEKSVRNDKKKLFVSRCNFVREPFQFVHRKNPSHFFVLLTIPGDTSMQATGNAAAAVGGAAAGPAAIPTFDSIMRDVETFLKAQGATTQQQLEELQRKAQTMETAAAKLRVEVTAAKKDAFTNMKLKEQLVICILYLVVCGVRACARCADCSDFCRPSR